MTDLPTLRAPRPPVQACGAGSLQTRRGYAQGPYRPGSFPRGGPRRRRAAGAAAPGAGVCAPVRTRLPPARGAWHPRDRRGHARFRLLGPHALRARRRGLRDGDSGGARRARHRRRRASSATTPARWSPPRSRCSSPRASSGCCSTARCRSRRPSARNGSSTAATRRSRSASSRDGAHFAKLFQVRYGFARDTVPVGTVTRYIVETLSGLAPFWYGHHAAFVYDHASTLRRVGHPTLILTNTGDQIYEHAQRARALRPDFAYRRARGRRHRRDRPVAGCLDRGGRGFRARGPLSRAGPSTQGLRDPMSLRSTWPVPGALGFGRGVGRTAQHRRGVRRGAAASRGIAPARASIRSTVYVRMFASMAPAAECAWWFMGALPRDVDGRRAGGHHPGGDRARPSHGTRRAAARSTSSGRRSACFGTS